MPEHIYTEDFLAAWNEYIDQYPARTKVMFSWDQFFSLSRADRSALVYCHEMMDTPGSAGIVYGAGDAWEDDYGMWDYYDMLAWLIDCASPHFKSLKPGDPLLREYVQTGHVQSCSHCGSHDVQAYGYAFRTKGSLLLICPRYGAVGHHRGLKDIHRHGDPDFIKFWPDMRDDGFYMNPCSFDTPDRQMPAPEDYGIRGETEG